MEFDVAQGWGSLCHFLDVSVPDEPFPHLNDTAEFRALFGLNLAEEEAQRRRQDWTRDSLENHFGAAIPHGHAD